MKTTPISLSLFDRDVQPEVARAASIVAGFERSTPGAEVFEAFEQLDDLPADVVRAVLSSVTGPAPDPERLDAETRRALGLPATAIVLRCSRSLAPKTVEELKRTEQEQVRLAGTTWDGHDLPAAARLARDGGESSFAGALELKTFVDLEGTTSFDAVLHGTGSAAGSGAIFTGGTTDVVGAVAYGVVEMKDKRARVGLQIVLTTLPDPAVEARAQAELAELRAAAQLQRDAEDKAEASARARREATEAKLAREAATSTPVTSSGAETVPKRAANTARAASVEEHATPSKKTAPAKKAAPAAKAAAKKTTAPKKMAAKKATSAPKKAAAVKTTKKTAAKKTPAKKTAAKKTAAKKTAAKKTAAKKTAAKKTPAKKTAAKKTAAKKTPAKKTTAPKKTTAKKKTAKKKTAPKAAAVKKTAPKKTAAVKKTAAPKKAATPTAAK